MKSNNYLLGITAAAIVLAGCSSKNNKGTERVSNAAASINENVLDIEAYSPGIAAANYQVQERKIAIDGKDTDFATVNEGTFEGHLSLWDDVSEVTAITRAIETKDQRLELYANKEVVMTLDLHAEVPTIAFTRAGFQAERIAFGRSNSEDGRSLAVVSFDLKACRVDQQQEQMDQEQMDKDQDAAMAEAGSLGEQSQGQEPIQPQGKEAALEKIETCKTVNTWIGLSEIAIEQPKQEQAPSTQEPIVPKEEKAVSPKQDVAPLEKGKQVDPVTPTQEESKKEAPLAPQQEKAPASEPAVAANEK